MVTIGHKVKVAEGHNPEVCDRERTIGFLRDNQLAFVCVDEPQGFKSSVPPVVEATSDIGVVRFHGRNAATWEQKGLAVQERFNYLYSDEELKGVGAQGQGARWQDYTAPRAVQ